MQNFNIRPIQTADNQAVAALIRTVMTAFGATKPGHSIHDPEVSQMAAAYSNPQSLYLILEDEAGQILGAAGFAPLVGGSTDTCELRKMYFYESARGKGWGEKMLLELLDAARQRGFKKMYLESIADMKSAIKLYEKTGFEKLPGKLGDTGHSACGVFYLKSL